MEDRLSSPDVPSTHTKQKARHTVQHRGIFVGLDPDRQRCQPQEGCTHHPPPPHCEDTVDLQKQIRDAQNRLEYMQARKSL